MKIFLEARQNRQFLLKNGYFGGVAEEAKNDRKKAKKSPSRDAAPERAEKLREGVMR